MDDLQLMLLLLAVLGDVSDAAPRQAQLHLRGVVFGGLVTLSKTEKGKVALEEPNMILL